MTVPSYHYSSCTTNTATINLHNYKQIETTTSYSVYSSDEEEGITDGDDDDCDCNDDDDDCGLPLLVKDEDERVQLMKLIIRIVSSSLAKQHQCSFCSYESINKILLNLVSVTKLNLRNFEKIVLMVIHHYQQRRQGQTECIKYTILGFFINQDGGPDGDCKLERWSRMLKMSKDTILELSKKYQKMPLTRQELVDFNGELLNLVRGGIRLLV